VGALENGKVHGSASVDGHCEGGANALGRISRWKLGSRDGGRQAIRGLSGQDKLNVALKKTEYFLKVAIRHPDRHFATPSFRRLSTMTPNQPLAISQVSSSLRQARKLRLALSCLHRAPLADVLLNLHAVQRGKPQNGHRHAESSRYRPEVVAGSLQDLPMITTSQLDFLNRQTVRSDLEGGPPLETPLLEPVLHGSSHRTGDKAPTHGSFPLPSFGNLEKALFADVQNVGFAAGA
jgi:hypothetical protein